MNQFTVNVNKLESDVCVIDLNGYLDAHTAADLEQVFSGAIEGGCRKFVVSFANLDYISSAGLGVFMVFFETVRQDGGDIRMASMQPKVFGVFDLLGFTVLFAIHPTVEAAVASYGS